MHGFVLSKEASALPRVDFRLDGWHLAVASHLPVTRVLDETGAQTGWIIGWAFEPKERRMIAGEERIERRGKTFEHYHRQHVRPLAGTYLAILSIDGDTRVYLDALGNLSCVFDPAREVVAGTAACFMDETEYAARFDAELYQQMEITREGWFPAGLTAHRGLERLMANHYLDCRRWRQIRHNAYEHASIADPSAVFSVIADEIAIPVEGAIAAERPVTLGLTGGGDSRLLLAGCRDFIGRVGFYTVCPPGKSPNSFDVIRAEELARRFGLRHRRLAYVAAGEEEARQWDRRVGDCVITNNRRQHPSVYPLDHDICIGGLGGEVGRCFLWPDMTNMPNTTAVAIIDQLKLPRVARVIERIEAWLEEIPVDEPTKLLDLAYIELRMGSWSSVQSYANPKSAIVHPLASFRSIEAMLSLAPEIRQNDGMIKGFIEQYWPELLELPINRYGDYRDLLKPLQKATNPVKVFRKARQILRARQA